MGLESFHPGSLVLASFSYTQLFGHEQPPLDPFHDVRFFRIVIKFQTKTKSLLSCLRMVKRTEFTTKFEGRKAMDFEVRCLDHVDF